MQHIDMYSEQERHVLYVGLDSLIYLDLVTVICTLALSIAIGQLSLSFLGRGHVYNVYINDKAFTKKACLTVSDYNVQKIN